MKNNKKEDKKCQSTLKLLGDYWTLSIIDSLASCELRFCELQRSLGMINPVTLTNRLQTLEESHLILRRVGAVDDLSVSYSLTSLGQEALQVVKALDSFSRKLAVNK